ncbi:MAG: hypothetical protein HOY71_33675 [Nonomuraea sp.]|nr:hypothetical protein [Nonomuraea sp.]
MIRKAAIAVALSAALLAPLVATAPSTAASKQAVELSVAAVTPDYATGPNMEIKLSGTVSNTTSAAMSGLSIRLRYSSQRFADRASMQAYLSGQTPQLGLISTSTQLLNQSVAANGSTPWEFVRTPAALGLNGFGVYPVAVEITQGYTSLAEVRTVITYTPDQPGQPRPPKTRLAVALPVIDQPHRSDDGTFIDDKLAAALGSKGDLADLAKIATTAPKSVTWFVEPGLLDDLDRMSQGYTVHGKDSDQKIGPSAAAKQWLDSMRSSLAAAPVVALPYADPDVTALAHQGLDAQTGRALVLGGQKARALLKRDVQTAAAWPVNGALDDDALDLLAVGGVKTVLLNSANVPPQQPTTATLDAAATLDSVAGPVTALLTDPELSRLFEAGAGDSGTLSKQRFVAETALISREEGPNPARSVVIAPSRRWNPNPALVNTLLKTAGKLPWLQMTQLGSIKPGKVQVPRAGLAYTDQDRKDELSAKYLAPVKDLAASALLTSQITAAKGPSAFDAAVLRAASSAWRNSTRAGRSLTKQVQSTVKADMAQIQVTGADRPRTLAGTDGKVPVSVRNSGSKPIALYIDVTSNDPEVLTIGSGSEKPKRELLQILAGQSGGLNVPMTAKSSGDATVSVQLTTADGLPYGKPVKLTIRTTGYTGIALVIVGAALAVMLAAVVTRIVRRRAGRKPASSPRTRESESV